jgi:23S rRNA (cytosine1962-C5)-methyltransferase
MAPLAVTLSHLWLSFPLERILYEDDDLIVIDKPVNVSTHAPDASRADDAVSRLRLALAERDRVAPESVYLGIHQRLDRDTSGVLLFTRRKSANQAVAAQFEGRKVKKTYRAGVVGWPPTLSRGVLKHMLAAGEEGRMRVVVADKVDRGQPRGRTKPTAVAKRARAASGPRAASSAREAVTHYQVIERTGDRAIVELYPETGRTHQLRVQVAAAGGAIAGDQLYGEVPAHRMMLHAARLVLRHPSSGTLLEVAAPLPADFTRWLVDPTPSVLPASVKDSDLFQERLTQAIQARWALGRSTDTTAFRVVHGGGDGLEGIAIDVYGDHLLVHFFSDEALAYKEVILDHVAALGARGVYTMSHPKQSNTLVDPRAESLAPSAPVRGEPAERPLVVWESGLAFRVRLGDGLKTGIFLDQRENRRRVRELSAGKRVLNLFAYTCGFTVAAAAGGASCTTSVDASRGVLEWGAENLEQNGFAGEHHTFVDQDVFTWLKLAIKRGERYDLVVLDPPSYATTKTSRFSAADDLPDLAARALQVVAPGGRMLACTNHRGISFRRFRKQMHEAGRLAKRTVLQLKDLPDPSDFPAFPGADPHLKSLLFTVE